MKGVWRHFDGLLEARATSGHRREAKTFQAAASLLYSRDQERVWVCATTGGRFTLRERFSFPDHVMLAERWTVVGWQVVLLSESDDFSPELLREAIAIVCSVPQLTEFNSPSYSPPKLEGR